ncbi:MAG: polyprenyl synthetase family protein [Verrucomicrobiota bacterium]
MTADLWWRRRVERARTLMNDYFSSGMGSLDRVEPRMAAALNDILARPGSLVRAVIAYQVGIEMAVPEESARAMACGIEYLHTASLVFDDLPAMDDARVRRGAACIHVVHGESVAMLAALAMINRGYAMIWQGIHHAQPAQRVAAGEWVDGRLGIGGVIGGQAHDLRGWRGEQSAAEVSEVAARKTGDLLRLALVLPAIVGSGTKREIQMLDRLALLRGLAYQAADDLKDVISAEDDSGKTVGRDETLGRPNLVLAEGLSAALHRFKRLSCLADRVQVALPGMAERWMMLDLLRVPLPASDEDLEKSLFSAAI